MRCLIFPMNGAGHLNACLGFASILKKFGHEVTISLAANLVQLVGSDQFNVVPYRDSRPRDSDPLLRWGKFMSNLVHGFSQDPLEQLQTLSVPFEESFIDETVTYNQQIALVIDQVRPDMIFIDFYTAVPSVIKSKIPWVLIYSCNPLSVFEKFGGPPAFAGFAINESPTLVEKFRSRRSELLREMNQKFEEWLESNGVKVEPNQNMRLSPYLNIYGYPEDLDYRELGPVPKGWFQLDHMKRMVDESAIGIDLNFLKTDHKIVLFALGSMGASDVNLMKKLIGFMSLSKHRFVVSKGPFHEEIQLSENMRGDKYLNQLKILPHTDLVINHGGNNSFIETLYYGKPMIVMPLFNDQHDNGRRAEEKRVGKCLYPYKVSKEELLSTLDALLEDQNMKRRVELIGARMRSSKKDQDLNLILEKIIESQSQLDHN